MVTTQVQELTQLEKDDLILAAETLMSIDYWESHVGNFIQDSLLDEQAEDMVNSLNSAIAKLRAR